MKLTSIPSFKRPREKLIERGPEGLTDHELVAVIIKTGYSGRDVIELSKKFIAKYPLRSFSKLSYQDIAHFKGLGVSRASTIIAAIEIHRRILLSKSTLRLLSPDDVIKAVAFIKERKREHFVGVYLNARSEIITVHTISIGTLDASIAHPRDVFSPAIHHNAAAVIIAHNHPSGDPEPSDADIELTIRIREAGKILGIQLLDHIIVSSKTTLSLKQEGYI